MRKKGKSQNALLLQKLELERQIQELASQAAGAGETLMACLNQKAEALEREKKQLEKRLGYEKPKVGANFQKLVSSALNGWNRLSNEEKSKAADGIIEEITIFQEGRLELLWRY